jgi:RNA polymerase primary sigma factor
MAIAAKLQRQPYTPAALQRKNRSPRAGRAIKNMKGRDGLAGADSTTLFLADLKKNGVPLLSREQEIDLARKVRAGDEQALGHLVAANVPLCVYLAKRTKSSGREKGLEFGDLVNAGVIGLRTAIQKFDPERGVLANFAYAHILGAIRDELKRAQTIRLPREALSLTNKIIRAKEQLRVNDYRKTSRGQRVWRGRAPTDEEIGTHLNIPEQTVVEILRHPSQPVEPSASSATGQVYDENAEGAWDLLEQSYNYRAEGDEEVHKQTRAEFENEHTEALAVSEDRAGLYKALEALTKQEREVLSRYFDLAQNPDIARPNAHGGESLTQIAKAMGISKQRASAVQRRARTKLRKALGNRVR